MVRSHAWLAALAASLVIGQGLAFAASAEKGKTEAGNDKGKALYVKHGCWQCHGFVGQGALTGPALVPKVMPLEAMTSFVRNANRAMPPYREAVLSNEDMAAIHAYLVSIPPPADPKTIPLLRD
jgi:ubiquinol-cytochrome c reductase cytochrome c subunit